MRWRCSGDRTPSGFRVEAVESCFSLHFPPRHTGVMMLKIPHEHPSPQPGQERATFEHRCESIEIFPNSPWLDYSFLSLVSAWGCLASIQALGHQARLVYPHTLWSDPSTQAAGISAFFGHLSWTLLLLLYLWSLSLSAFFQCLLGCPLALLTLFSAPALLNFALVLGFLGWAGLHRASTHPEFFCP